MARDLLMPKLGLTMREGTLLEWQVEPGQAVKAGQVLFVVETEKVATEVEADADGILVERLAAAGEVVEVGKAVGRLSSPVGGASEREVAPQAIEAAGPDVAPTAAGRPSGQGSRRPSDARIVATPLARRIAGERGVDLAKVAGSGPRGRIKAVDVERAAAPAPAAGEAAIVRSPAVHALQRPSPVQASMAKRLAEVKHGVPHFYLATEVEVTRLVGLRAELNANSELPRLTLTHFVLAAAGRALLDMPGMNRVWMEDGILAYAASDVGMAVETDQGLFVPVVRDAGVAGLDTVAAAARGLVEKARAGMLRASDIGGATLSVSNAGMFDVTWLTPIINPGQSAILGVGSVRQVFRPDGDGAPVLRNELGLVLSGDHRVHTGVEGLAFLNRVKAFLEQPLSLLRHTHAQGS